MKDSSCRAIEELMTTRVVALPPDAALSEAVRHMGAARISSVVVAEGGVALGIVTERDILRAFCRGVEKGRLVRDFMSQPAVTVALGTDLRNAYHVMASHRIRHLVVVDGKGDMAGIVSETDFRRQGGIEAFVGLRDVASVMDTGFSVLDRDRRAGEAAAIMEGRRSTCVLVGERRQPEGIVTERDIVRLYLDGAADQSLAEAMSAPLISVRSETPLVEAARLMQDEDIRHLVVRSAEGHVVGVLSEHDLVRHTEDTYVDLLESVIRQQSEELLRQQEVMDLQRLREAVADTEFRYRHILEQLPQRIFVKDCDLNYLFCNGQFAAGLGRTPAEVAGQTDYTLFPAELAERYRRHDRQVLEAGETISVEEQPTLINGRESWLRTSKTPLRDTGGRIVGVVGISDDITQARRLQREVVSLNRDLEKRVADRTARLQAVNRELAALSYTLSHDLRTPLRAINGYVTLLRDSLAARLSAEEQGFMERIRANSVRMGDLMDDVLAYSRVGGEIHPEAVDLETLAGEVAAERSSLYPATVISVGHLPVVRADRGMMRQLFGNLLDNALKFSAKVGEPRVEIGSTEEDGRMVFHVRDNGAGFDPREAGRLFSIFERLHAGEFPGTGIGLTIVKRIVEQHGGSVWAESSPGQGACFLFLLGDGTVLPA